MSIFKQVKGSGSVTAPEPTHIGRQSRPLRALQTFVARRKVWVIEGKAWVDFGGVHLEKPQTIGSWVEFALWVKPERRKNETIG